MSGEVTGERLSETYAHGVTVLHAACNRLASHWANENGAAATLQHW